MFNKHLLVAIATSLTWLPALAGSLTLTGTVRDFAADGVNFEGPCCYYGPNYVNTTLSGTAPTLTETGLTSGHISNSGVGAFDNWFTKSIDTLSYSITLDEYTAGSGLYKYTNNNFFPIDGQLLGNYALGHNYHFTYSIAATFSYIAGTHQTFAFSGDDDVWVFFDKKLGIDLGGVHGTQGASVDLDTVMEGKASGDYSFDFFFAERHTTGSNLMITTSLVLRDQPSNVPEPGSIALLGLGLASFAGLRRRKGG